MRRPNNPMLIQIERHARRAELRQMAREISGLILVAAGAYLLVASLAVMF